MFTIFSVTLYLDSYINFIVRIDKKVEPTLVFKKISRTNVEHFYFSTDFKIP